MRILGVSYENLEKRALNQGAPARIVSTELPKKATKTNFRISKSAIIASSILKLFDGVVTVLSILAYTPLVLSRRAQRCTGSDTGIKINLHKENYAKKSEIGVYDFDIYGFSIF